MVSGLFSSDGKKATRGCPCGHAGDPAHACTCPPGAVERYHRRLSGPLLDRIDLHVDVPALPRDELLDGPDGESSREVRRRVVAARARQRHRLGPITTNASMRPSELERDTPLDAATRRLLERGIDRLGLSARAYARVRRVARTIADLAGRERVEAPDVAEALQYRTLDRRAG